MAVATAMDMGLSQKINPNEYTTLPQKTQKTRRGNMITPLVENKKQMKILGRLHLNVCFARKSGMSFGNVEVSAP